MGAGFKYIIFGAFAFGAFALLGGFGYPENLQYGGLAQIIEESRDLKSQGSLIDPFGTSGGSASDLGGFNTGGSLDSGQGGLGDIDRGFGSTDTSRGDLFPGSSGTETTSGLGDVDIVPIQPLPTEGTKSPESSTEPAPSGGTGSSAPLPSSGQTTAPTVPISSEPEQTTQSEQQTQTTPSGGLQPRGPVQFGPVSAPVVFQDVIDSVSGGSQSEPKTIYINPTDSQIVVAKQNSISLEGDVVLKEQIYLPVNTRVSLQPTAEYSVPLQVSGPRTSIGKLVLESAEVKTISAGDLVEQILVSAGASVKVPAEGEFGGLLVDKPSAASVGLQWIRNTAQNLRNFFAGIFAGDAGVGIGQEGEAFRGFDLPVPTDGSGRGSCRETGSSIDAGGPVCGGVCRDQNLECRAPLLSEQNQPQAGGAVIGSAEKPQENGSLLGPESPGCGCYPKLSEVKDLELYVSALDAGAACWNENETKGQLPSIVISYPVSKTFTKNTGSAKTECKEQEVCVGFKQYCEDITVSGNKQQKVCIQQCVQKQTQNVCETVSGSESGEDFAKRIREEITAEAEQACVESAKEQINNSAFAQCDLDCPSVGPNGEKPFCLECSRDLEVEYTCTANQADISSLSGTFKTNESDATAERSAGVIGKATNAGASEGSAKQAAVISINGTVRVEVDGNWQKHQTCSAEPNTENLRGSGAGSGGTDGGAGGGGGGGAKEDEEEEDEPTVSPLPKTDEEDKKEKEQGESAGFLKRLADALKKAGEAIGGLFGARDQEAEEEEEAEQEEPEPANSTPVEPKKDEEEKEEEDGEQKEPEKKQEDKPVVENPSPIQPWGKSDTDPQPPVVKEEPKTPQPEQPAAKPKDQEGSSVCKAPVININGLASALGDGAGTLWSGDELRSIGLSEFAKQVNAVKNGEGEFALFNPAQAEKAIQLVAQNATCEPIVCSEGGTCQLFVGAEKVGTPHPLFPTLQCSCQSGGETTSLEPKPEEKEEPVQTPVPQAEGGKGPTCEESPAPQCGGSCEVKGEKCGAPLFTVTVSTCAVNYDSSYPGAHSGYSLEEWNTEVERLVGLQSDALGLGLSDTHESETCSEITVAVRARVCSCPSERRVPAPGVKEETQTPANSTVPEPRVPLPQPPAPTNGQSAKVQCTYRNEFRYNVHNARDINRCPGCRDLHAKEQGIIQRFAAMGVKVTKDSSLSAPHSCGAAPVVFIQRIRVGSPKPQCPDDPRKIIILCGVGAPKSADNFEAEIQKLNQRP